MDEEEMRVIHVSGRKTPPEECMRKGNTHVNMNRIHRIFSAPEFVEGDDDLLSEVLPQNGFTLLCTAHAICDHFIECYPAIPMGHEEYAWFLLMACVYVHRACADVPYDDRSFATWFGMTQDIFLREYLCFCQILFDMPLAKVRVRMLPAIFDMSGRGDYSGPIVRVYPFEL
jgi:hypothetical protein